MRKLVLHHKSTHTITTVMTSIAAFASGDSALSFPPSFAGGVAGEPGPAVVGLLDASAMPFVVVVLVVYYTR